MSNAVPTAKSTVKRVAVAIAAIVAISGIAGCDGNSDEQAPQPAVTVTAPATPAPTTAAPEPAPTASAPTSVDWTSTYFDSNADLVAAFETAIGADCEVYETAENGAVSNMCVTERGNVVGIVYLPAEYASAENLELVGEASGIHYLTGTNWVVIAESEGNRDAVVERLLAQGQAV